jgi:alpha-beta hydrolase superfamily lysophospholipase
MVLLAPAFYIDNKYSFWIKIGRILNKIYPSLPLLKIKAEIDAETMNYMKNDPLIYKGKMSVGTGLTIVDSINYSNNNLNKVTTPCYLLQGKHDTICKYEGASNFFEKILIKDKTYVLRDGKINFYFLMYRH